MKNLYFFLVIVCMTVFTPSSFAQVWTQVGEDIDGEAAEDQSGNSIDLSADGNIIAIGGWQNDGNGLDAGHVRIYKNNNGIWEQLGSDIEGEAGEKKGFSVSLNDMGDIVALSTPYVNSNTGKVSIYQNINGVWTQLGDDIYGKGEYYYGGVSIELSPDGKLIAISNHFDVGYIRLYEYKNDTWNLADEITGSLYNEQLGGTGIQFNNDASILATRSSTAKIVRIFKKQPNGDWKQMGDSIPEAHSSFSLSLDSLTIAIGDAGWFGTVKVFQYQNNSWAQKGNDMGGWFTNTGYAKTVKLSSDGNMVLVSAITDNFSTGLVRTYVDSAGVWVQKGDDIIGEDQYNNFGTKLCLSSNDSVLAVSAPKNSEVGNDAGHVRIFKYENNIPVHANLSDSVCENVLPYQFGTQSLNSEGTFVDTLDAVSGVDSIVTLTLSIHESPNPDFSYDADTLTSVNTHTSYQWYDQDGVIEGATSNRYIIKNSGTYYLKATNDNGCSEMSGGMELIKTDIEDLFNGQANINVFPNPNNGEFLLNFENNTEGEYQVQIIDVAGQVQQNSSFYITSNNHLEQFNLSHLSKGSYFIKVFNSESVQTKKVVFR